MPKQLRFVSDSNPGIRRVKAGNGFRYVDAKDRDLRDRKTLGRIRKLAIPPAWTEVWICPNANGHIQAVGRDQRRRKQYRYHADYRAERDNAKFDRMVAFARALPRIRLTVAQDLSARGLSRRKVLAAVLRLLETSLIRVGNEEYAKHNGSFGLTTLQDRHVSVGSDVIRFRFLGKSGKAHEIGVRDRRLARIVKQCQDLPGQELFQYLDEEGKVQDVRSNDVNGYMREVAGHEFSAKDFRTWAGTVLAAMALQEFEAFDSQTKAKKNVMAAIRRVAEKLGNTPTVCRKCYIHPRIIDAYLQGTTLDAIRRRAAGAMKRIKDLEPEEAAVLALLQGRLANDSHS